MAHIHDLYDFTTSAFIVHGNKVLLLHHKKLDMWLQPGGHIELDEHPLEALWRELEEETGLTQGELAVVELAPGRPQTDQPAIGLPIPFDINVHPFKDAGHKHIDLSYLMRSTTQTVRLEAEGAHALDWFSRERLADKLAAGEIYKNTYYRAMFALEHVGSVQ